MPLIGEKYQMLELLSLRQGATLTKEMFLNHLCGGMDEPELKIIDVFICKLRKKLADASEGRNFIETVWGRGYVLREPQRRSPHPRLIVFQGELCQALASRLDPAANGGVFSLWRGRSSFVGPASSEPQLSSIFPRSLDILLVASPTLWLISWINSGLSGFENQF